MRTNRRMMLAGVAGATGAGALAWWGLSGWWLPRFGGPSPYQAWEDWRGEPDEPVRNLVRAGILASNPRNAQPWLFRLSPNRIEIIADPDRGTGQLDPYLREMHLGLGCAIENMALAAPASGFSLEPHYATGRLGPHSPAGPSAGPAAILRLSKHRGTSDPLFDDIPKRHTNRGPYDPGRAVPRDVMEALAKLVETEDIHLLWLSDTDKRAQLGGMLIQASRTVLKHPSLVPLWKRWLRPDETAQKTGDGVPIDANLNDAAAAWIDQTRMQTSTAPLFGVLMLRDPYDIPSVMRAGRAWQRIHLDIARRGLAAQPMNQILWRMEYEENLSAQSPTAPGVYALLDSEPFRPALFFRIGYAKKDPTITPRRPLENVILTSA